MRSSRHADRTALPSMADVCQRSESLRTAAAVHARR